MRQPTLYRHQREALKRSQGRVAYAWLMEMGTGKTRVALAELWRCYEAEDISAALILAPAGMYHQWPEELARFYTAEQTRQTQVYLWTPSMAQGERALRRTLLRGPEEGLSIVVMNIEALSTAKGRAFAGDFVRAHCCMLIIDEGSTIKNRSALRTKAVLALAKLCPLRRLLNGAPVTNGPLDLWTQFAALDPTILGENYWSFRSHYAVLKELHVGGGRRVNVVVGYQRLDDLQRAIAPISYRVTKSECLELPPKIYQTVLAPLEGEAKRAYISMRELAIYEVEKAGGVITAPLAITRINKLRQLAQGFIHDGLGIVSTVDGCPRLEVLMDTLEAIDGKVVIWCNHLYALKAIERELQTVYGLKSALTYHGETKETERQLAQKLFNATDSSVRFLVAIPSTGRYGLNLQDACSTVVYYTNDYSYDTRIQSEDRVHRIGQKHPVTYIDIIAPDTVDVAIRKALALKKDLADLITRNNVKELL